MDAAPQAFPLAWPTGRPRTPGNQRKEGKFSAKAHNGRWVETRRLTINEAMVRLTDEVERLGGRYPLLSSNLEVRLDGRPRSGQGEPADPGVCVYFQLSGKPYALACDTYSRAAQNIAALAAHIEATRAITRHGVASAAETLQAFQALPAPTTWRDVLGGPTTRAEATAAYRRLAADAHPDRGGSDDRMAELNAARDAAMKALPAE